MPQEIIQALIRKKYDSNIIWLCSNGKEKHLPEAFRKSIPYSTISTWRNIIYIIIEYNVPHRCKGFTVIPRR